MTRDVQLNRYSDCGASLSLNPWKVVLEDWGIRQHKRDCGFRDRNGRKEQLNLRTLLVDGAFVHSRGFRMPLDFISSSIYTQQPWEPILALHCWDWETNQNHLLCQSLWWVVLRNGLTLLPNAGVRSCIQWHKAPSLLLCLEVWLLSSMRLTPGWWVSYGRLSRTLPPPPSCPFLGTRTGLVQVSQFTTNRSLFELWFTGLDCSQISGVYQMTQIYLWLYGNLGLLSVQVS